jgi:hypothetical protein
LIPSAGRAAFVPAMTFSHEHEERAMRWMTVCLLGILAGSGFAGDQLFSWSGWSTAAYHGYACGDCGSGGKRAGSVS